MATKYLDVKFVIKLDSDGNYKFYFPKNNESLGDSLDTAKKEQVTGEILKTVQVTIQLPPDPNAKPDPPVDIVIKG